MLRKDELKTDHAAPNASTADPSEIARFNRLAEDWWRPDGTLKVVHKFNATRVAHLKRIIPAHFATAAGQDAASPLAGLTIADVGCGAGIVAEPLARSGAAVTGIDAAARNIAVAAHHAKASGVDITYRNILPEALVAEGRQFDVVLSLEVVEHVAHVQAFLRACAALVRPGGLLVIGTLNRTVKSYVLAIVGAEYVLGWLPKGTHEWQRFLTPAELQATLTRYDMTAGATDGVVLNPVTNVWSISADASVNYLRCFTKRTATVS
jgi:2-polyprenyl-6-hydroxyphenyl methylase / 3-demethylubiquinone-9 3-methyltransferase